MSRSRREEIAALGFSPAGAYSDDSFQIAEHWRSREVVYLWTCGQDATNILRVGIACGPNGFGQRYDHYNRWLAGRFKPNDAREQKVRALFTSKLNSDCQIWAREVEGKAQALKEEAILRRRWGVILELDLMVQGSWAKLQMQAWRAAQRAVDTTASTGKSTARSTHEPPSSKVPKMGDLKALAARLDTMLVELGLEPVPVGRGTSYKSGAATICRIDPKPTKAVLRVEVGREAERAAPSVLRGCYRQEGWLVVGPEYAAVGCDYVERCATARLRGS